MLTLFIGLIFQPLPLVLHQPCQQSPLVTNLNQQGSFQICRLQAPNGFQQTCYSSYFILDLVTAPELVQPHHSLRICPAWRRVFLEVIPFISIFNHESGSDRIGHILRNFKWLIDLCDCILTHAWSVMSMIIASSVVTNYSSPGPGPGPEAIPRSVFASALCLII